MKLDLMGLKINSDSRDSILEQIAERLEKGQKTFIVTPYSEFFYYAAKDNQFKNVINSADFALPDGMSVLWLAYYLSIPLTIENYYLKILQGFWQGLHTGLAILFNPKRAKTIIPERISGSKFFWDLIELAVKKDLSIFLLGGFGDTPKIVSEKISQKYKNIKICGYSNAGPEKVNLVSEISLAEPDIIFVAYGPVRQEKWIFENINQLNAKIFIGVGGTFDYISGKKSLPPEFIRRIGLEWLYRLITQPYRFKRIWHATVSFTLGALRYKVFMSLPFRESVVGVIINSEKEIFVAKRAPKKRNSDTDNWQLPQGGVDKKESPEGAILREMSEETGMRNLEIIGKGRNMYSYDWAHFYRKFFFNKYRFRGQRQTIFFLQLSKNNSLDQIQLEKDELVDYKWVSVSELTLIISPVRRQMLAVALADINKYL